MRNPICPLAFPLLLLLANAPAVAQADRAARLGQLQNDILSAASATEFLTQRCAGLHLVDPVVVKAEQVPNAPGTATADIRALLKVSDAEPLRYRRVQLKCGPLALSVADNWYVPARLTPAMNDRLDHSDTSFGTVVKPLDFHRRTVTMATPKGGDAIGPQTVFQLEAVLLTPDETPFSLVIENYQAVLLQNPR